MDREGFLFNESFEQLVDIVRGGIEFLAREDRERLLQASERVAKEAVKKTRADFRAAVKYIEQSSTLTRTDKARLVEEYTGLAQKLTEVEDYDREARRKLETMSALGVVAGFMTHEASRIVSSLKDVIAELNHIARRHPSVKHNIAKIEEAYHALEGQLQYSRTFVDATQRDQRAKFKAAGQIEMIIERFGNFAKQRKIELEMDVEDSTAAPEMPVAVYSGIVLNLYTNALKSILATPTGKDASKVLFRAYNDKKWHNLEVLDTGIGIPPDLRKRVFDLLFTTTSRLNNPLGSGMGLGFTLVKQLVEQLGGRVAIVDSPVQGFNTCFRVQLPW
jgi:signal transduction histidine kinase